MRDDTLTADQKMDKLLELDKGKKRTRATPTPRPYEEEDNPAPGPAPAQEDSRLVLSEKGPKKPRAKAKAVAAAAIKDSVVVEAKPKAKARVSKNAPLLAIEGPEQPKALAPPARAGPPKGKKPTIRVLPLTSSTSVNKEGTALKPKGKARGRPRKALVASAVEPEFA
jgi:hypothetical protein